MNNFLHNHPRLETELDLGKEHVIIDRKHWDLVLQFLCETGEINRLDRLSRLPNSPYKDYTVKTPQKPKLKIKCIKETNN